MLPFRSAAPCHHATSTSGVVLPGRFANVCNNYTKAWMRSAASSKYSASAFVENNSKNDSNISAVRKHASRWSFSSSGTAFHFPSTIPVGHCSLRFASNCGSSSSSSSSSKKTHREKDIADVLRIVKKVSTSLPKQMKESMTKTNKKIAAMDNTLKGNEKEMKQKFAAMDKTLKVTRKQMNERFGAVYKTLERNSEEMNNNFGAVEKEVNEITAGSRRLEDKFNKVHTHGSRALVGYCSVGVVAFVYALHSSSWFRTLPPLRDDSSSSPPKRGR